MARSTYWTVTFWADTLERSVKTAAQAVLAVLGLSNTGFGNLFEFDWTVLGQAALSGFVLSVLTSLVSAPIGSNGTASVLPSPPGPEAPPEGTPWKDDDAFPPPVGG